MIVVLAVITGASGLLLAGVDQGTRDQRKKQLLQYVKGPAVSDVLMGSENQPLEDVREMEVTPDGEGAGRVVDIFPAYKNGELWAVAFETTGKGYGGEIGVIVGIDVDAEELLGIGITTHKETPGLGARIQEAGFRSDFEGIGLSGEAKVKAEGGDVDALSGATVSSKGVCEAVNQAFAFYRDHKEEILAKAKATGE